MQKNTELRSADVYAACWGHLTDTNGWKYKEVNMHLKLEVNGEVKSVMQ
jgi:hypothetical protein